MNRPALNFAKHLSIVWGVTLAIITVVEWNSLERDPMREQILSPFIERRISASVESAVSSGEDVLSESQHVAEEDEIPLRYEVEFGFNGPLFLAGFFLPVLLFHGLAWALGMIRKPVDSRRDGQG